jgi:AcrR family transcriptional regulator
LQEHGKVIANVEDRIATRIAELGADYGPSPMHARGLAMNSAGNSRSARDRTVSDRTAPSWQRFGRPRDGRIDSQVVSAVLSALKRGGYRAVTIDGIARKVGRARSSLYRRWPSKRHLVAYAVVTEMGENPAADTGGLRGDLEAAVGTLSRAFAGPLGRALAGLAADMAQDAALASIIQQEVLAPRRKSMREALDRARVRGEVRPDCDVELVLDMLTGPFYFRTLFGHAAITGTMAQLVVQYVLRVAQPTDLSAR